MSVFVLKKRKAKKKNSFDVLSCSLFVVLNKNSPVGNAFSSPSLSLPQVLARPWALAILPSLHLIVLSRIPRAPTRAKSEIASEKANENERTEKRERRISRLDGDADFADDAADAADAHRHAASAPVALR